MSLRVQSFHQVGFPATQVFERAGPIVDPMYHNSGASPIVPCYTDSLNVHISQVI